MVLAGPGSGKTTVITERVRFLIETAGVHPASILVVTFTKAAAAQMRARFFSLCGNTALPVSFGTFHSIFFSILKAAYNYSAADIITDAGRMEIFREIIAELDIEMDDTPDFLNGVAGEVSLVKGEHIDPAYYYSVNCADDIFRNIFAAYNRRLHQSHRIDFDDMLTFTWELFSQRPDILRAWQRRFRYILIDEFQDINRLQYEIIRKLAAPENNLFIVGDDDQSIYRFRGAKPEIMLGFTNDYPDAKTIILNVNYRCSSPIVEAALRVINNNKTRYKKQLKAANPGNTPVDVKQFENMQEEYDTLIKELYHYHKEGIPLKNMAVLYRTNTGARQLLARLMEYNVPFRVRDSVSNLFEHWIARDMLAYIRIALGRSGRSDYLRVINRPKRYISRQLMSLAAGPDLSDFKRVLTAVKKGCQDKEWIAQRMDQLIYDLTSIRAMEPYAALSYIRYGMGYDAWLVDYARERRLKEDELLEVAADILESARGFEHFEDWFQYIDDYGHRLNARRRQQQDDDTDAVVLSTMHSAKGLEYDVVFIIDANAGVIPHKKAVLEADVEEERRMFYVAMTRARNCLHIYFARERYHKPAEMSCFVGELLMDRSRFVKGARVRHRTYGEGTVMEVTPTAVKILFSKSKAIKTLNLSFCISNQMLSLVREADIH